jgi:hypothetical protein
VRAHAAPWALPRLTGTQRCGARVGMARATAGGRDNLAGRMLQRSAGVARADGGRAGHRAVLERGRAADGDDPFADLRLFDPEHRSGIRCRWPVRSRRGRGRRRRGPWSPGSPRGNDCRCRHRGRPWSRWSGRHSTPPSAGRPDPRSVVSCWFGRRAPVSVPEHAAIPVHGIDHRCSCSELPHHPHALDRPGTAPEALPAVRAVPGPCHLHAVATSWPVRAAGSDTGSGL